MSLASAGRHPFLLAVLLVLVATLTGCPPAKTRRKATPRVKVAPEPARPKKPAHAKHEHGHLHPHPANDHHHHPHPHPHMVGSDGHHHPY